MVLTQVQIEHRDQDCSSVLRQTADGGWYHQLHLLSPESIQDSSSLAHTYLLKSFNLDLKCQCLLFSPSSFTWAFGGYSVFRTLGRYVSWKVILAISLALIHLSSEFFKLFNLTDSWIIWASNFVNMATNGTMINDEHIIILLLDISGTSNDEGHICQNNRWLNLPFPVPLLKNSSSVDWSGRVLSMGIQYLWEDLLCNDK